MRQGEGTEGTNVRRDGGQAGARGPPAEAASQSVCLPRCGALSGTSLRAWVSPPPQAEIANVESACAGPVTPRVAYVGPECSRVPGAGFEGTLCQVKIQKAEGSRRQTFRMPRTSFKVSAGACRRDVASGWGLPAAVWGASGAHTPGAIFSLRPRRHLTQRWPGGSRRPCLSPQPGMKRPLLQAHQAGKGERPPARRGLGQWLRLVPWAPGLLSAPLVSPGQGPRTRAQLGCGGDGADGGS